MEDLFTILFIVFFFVLPILEKVLRGGKATSPPKVPPGRERARGTLESGERPPPRVLSGGVLTRDEPRDDPAAGMVPDDLWAVLTGEKRPGTPAPGRRPAARTEVPREASPWEPRSEEEEVEALLRGQAEERARQVREREERLRVARAGRKEVKREAPRVVSLERELGDPEARHSAFHDRIAATEVGARTGRNEQRQAGLNALGLGNRAELRRAFVVQEVLGPPRSLVALEESTTER